MISLPFLPSKLDPPFKQRIYQAAMKELLEKKDKARGLSKAKKDAQETASIKKAWQVIAKKEIPKMFRIYQK